MSLIYKGQTISGGSGAGGGGVPKGTIVIWSGAATAIPSGWALCDGQNGTPDLRDRFVVGAGTSYEVGATGGEKEHTLTVPEIPNHTHVVPTASTSDSTSGVRFYLTKSSVDSNSTIASMVEATDPTTPHNNLPPYYALCYIMKMTDGGSGAGSSDSSEEIYSTEETRIGTWIDGKPLYRICAAGTTGSSTTSNPTLIDLSSASIDTVTLLRGTVTNKNGNRYPIPNQSNEGYIMVYLTDSNVVKVSTSNNLYLNRSCYAIVEYTKTTDEATS